MRALIVTEKQQTLSWVRSALGPAWESEHVQNGLEARTAAAEDDFDVVIADESTVPYGAFGLARELKAQPDPPAVIVVLERAQDTWLSKWSGADAWFVQPVDPFEIARAAQHLAAGRAEPALVDTAGREAGELSLDGRADQAVDAGGTDIGEIGEPQGGR